jgi:NADH:ubiquinone oxidoreductase subunit 5 (subunit L)/multisubunit Na+/H+ antiporter MnhA subunit
VGICSYLLVSFWNTRNAAIKSALKAILVNRFGDVGFIMATIVLLNTTGSLQFEEMEAYFNGSSQEVNLLTLLVLIAVAGKSAQFGLHS